MISCLVIHPDISVRQSEIEKILTDLDLSQNNINTLWFAEEEKLGIGESRKIQKFLSLKPYQGKNQAVVLLAAENLTLDAQNSLLKTLEEAGDYVSLILGVSSEDQLLPTIVSRCKTINLQFHAPTSSTSLMANASDVETQYQADIEKLLEFNMEERFKFIEKLEDKENFLRALTAYFRQKWNINFLKDLLEAEKWAKQNVNIRAILEYLMLRLPKDNQN